MRIFYAFLILVTSALLWLVPITSIVYDFRTDVREDDYDWTTNVGVTSVNMTLHDFVYDNDITKIDVTSDDDADLPVIASYNGTLHTALTTGLSENLTRTLTYTYDIDALNGSTAWDTLLNIIPLIWMVLIIAFPVAALAAIFTGRA